MTDPVKSPFSSLLESNALPLDQEVDAIKVYLTDCLAQATALDNALKEMQQKRDALAQVIDQHRGLIHPLRRNEDILQEIFLHCLPTQHDAFISPSEIPMLLTRVCRQWRNLALATPRLWASIYISIPTFEGTFNGLDVQPCDDSSKAKREALLGALEGWLSRSGTCPLSISIFGAQAWGGNHSDMDGSTFFDQILRHASRWRRLVLFGGESDLKTFGTLEAFQLPLLEDVVVDIQKPFMLPAASPTQSAWAQFGLLTAPTIKRLCLRNVNPSSIPIVWENLTHVSFEDGSTNTMTVTEALNLLKRCPNVVSALLKFSPPIHANSSQNSPRPFSSPRLRHLSVQFLIEDDAPTFLENLQAPNLQEFTFPGFLPSPRSDGIDPVLQFVMQINSLRRLSFHPSTFTSQQLEAILRVCPGLVALRSCSNFVQESRRSYPGLPPALNDIVLQRLTPSELQSDYLCPQLTSLTATNANFQPETLCNFLLARARAAHSDENHLPEITYLDVRFPVHHDIDSHFGTLPKSLRDKLRHSQGKEYHRKLYSPRNGYLQLQRYPLFARSAESGDRFDYRLFDMDA